MTAGPFRSWNAVEPFEFVEGVRLQAIGGEQVLLCRVTYEPGKRVPLHKHDETEQVMFIVDGSVDMAIEGETWTLAEPTWFPSAAACTTSSTRKAA